MSAMRYGRRRVRYASVAGGERVRTIEWWQLVGTMPIAPGATRPRADVYETADRILVTVELPGLDPDDVGIQLYEDVLIVEGRRSVPPGFADGRYHAAEIPRGDLRLQLALPSLIDPEAAEARLERGILELRLPKAGLGA
jgi:HSP20 family protein